MAAAGIWAGELEVETNGQPGTRTVVEVRALVTADGEFRWILDEIGQQIVGRLLVEGGELRTSYGLMWYEFPWWITSDSESQGTFDLVAGSVEEHVSLKGTFQSTWPDTSERVGSFSLEYDPSYELDSSYAVLAGTYTGANETLAIGDAGELFYQSSATGCVGNGDTQLIRPESNLYSMRIELHSCTGADAARNGLPYTGLAYLVPNYTGFGNDVLELAMSIPLSASIATDHFLWNLSLSR
jgi:hypothetical protein